MRPLARPLAWSFGLPLPVTLFLVAAVLRILAFAVLYFGSVLMGYHGSVDLYDSVFYDRLAWYAAEQIRSGHWVDLRAASLEGSWDVGFTYLVALQYALVGHHPEVPRILNCLFAAFTAPATYIAAKRTTIGEKTAARAGWLVAFWPLSLYWAGFDLLKDPLIWFVLSLALLALTSRSRLVRPVLGAATSGAVYVVRTYMGPGVGVLLLAAAALKRDWRGLVATLGALLVVQVGVIAFGFPPMWALNPFKSNGQLGGGGTTTSVCSGLGAGAVVGQLSTSECAVPLTFTPKALALRIGVGIPVVLYGPGLKPLKNFQHPTLDWGMYPGLLVWSALIPFGLLGLWRVLRKRDATLWGIALFSLGIWGALALIYAGHAVRQREMAFPATLILASIGLERPWPRLWQLPYAAYWLVVLGGLAWEAGFI
jgi:hypothetical protein